MRKAFNNFRTSWTLAPAIEKVALVVDVLLVILITISILG